MFDWSDEKDAQLRKERGIGFQDIVYHIAKTIIPSRKQTKRLLKGNKDEI